MKIIHKYVLREHAGPLVFAVSALTSLLLLNYIAKQFGNLVGKGLPWSVILEFFGLSVPFTVAMTFPMAVLVATLYAFSRLAAENEITALKASGVSLVRLLTPVLIAAAFLSGLMVYFNDQVLPRANHRLRTLQGDIARKKPTFALKEQIINEVSPGKLFLRANHIDEFSNRMQEITIYDLSDPLRRRTIYADSGVMAIAPNETDLILTLYDGSMIEVPKEKPLQLKRLFYKIDHVRAVDVMNQLTLTTDDNYKSDREMSVCELQGEVARGEVEFERARADLRRALVGAAHEAVTGAPPMLPPDTTSPLLPGMGRKAPRSHRISLGRVYCDAQEKLAGLTERIRDRAVAWWAPSELFANEGPSRRTDDRRSAIGDRRSAVGGDVAVAGLAQDTIKKDTTKARRDSASAGADSAMGAADTGRARPDTNRVERPVQGGDSARKPTIVPDPGMPANINPQLPIDTPQRRIDSASARRVPDDSVNVFAPATPRPAIPTPNVRGTSTLIPSQPYLMTAALEGARSRMAESERMANQNAVELHKKFAISVACFVFVLVGAPIALRFPRAGVGLVIGVSLAVFAVYYVGLIGGEALADRGFLPPALAMWSTNLLLTVIGLALLSRIGAEGATARGGDVGEMLELVRGWFGRFRRTKGATPPPPASPATPSPEPST